MTTAMTTINWDEPIEDADGNPARVISKNYREGLLNLCVVQIDITLMSSVIRLYYANGSPWVPVDGGMRYTIRNVKKKREGWVNVYHHAADVHKHLFTGRKVFSSKASAENLGGFRAKTDAGNTVYVGAIKIEVEV